MEICNTYFNLITKDKDAAVKYYLLHSDTISKTMRAYLESRDIVCYYYLVTFTIDPKINTSSDDEIESYIKKQFTDRPSLKVLEAHIVKEFTQKGIAHWHVSCKTGKPLKKDRFHYYMRKYGQIDISKNRHKNLNDGLNYISECDTPTRLVAEEDLTLQQQPKGTKGYSRSMFLDFD